MATRETVDETTVSIDIPEMISVKLADHEKEYWIEKDQLLEASAFFKGMFSWEFKVRSPNALLSNPLISTGIQNQAGHPP